MKKATILFGSTTGNTEIVADKIAENMPDYTVRVIYVTDAKDDAAVQEADLVIYGCSTMGLGRTSPSSAWATRRTMRITSAGRQTCWPRR